MNGEELLNLIKELKIDESIDQITSKYITTFAIDFILAVAVLVVGIVLLAQLLKIYFKNRDTEYWQDWMDFVFDNMIKSVVAVLLLAIGTIASTYNGVTLIHWVLNPNGMLLQVLLN